MTSSLLLALLAHDVPQQSLVRGHVGTVAHLLAEGRQGLAQHSGACSLFALEWL